MDNNNEENENLEEISSLEDTEQQTNEIYNAGKVEASKALLKILLKKKTILIVAVAFLAFFLLLIFIAVFDSSNGNQYVYKKVDYPKTVTITSSDGKDGYKETRMALEDYVKSGTLLYTKDIVADDAYLKELYKVVSITLRTQAISKNGNVESFYIPINNVSTSNKLYDDILLQTKGLIMVDLNDNVLDAEISSFCWDGTTSTESDYLIHQANNMTLPRDYMKNYLPEMEKDCPCNYSNVMGEEIDEGDTDGLSASCWYMWEENKTVTNKDGTTSEETHYYRTYKARDDLNGLSVYGAFYGMKRFAKNYDDMLRYFFGSNISYRTIYDNSEELEKNKNYSSLCGTADEEHNLISFISGFEGEESCDENNYKVYDKDRAKYTVGHGTTNYDIESTIIKNYIDQNNYGQYFRKNSKGYTLNVGDCVPKNVIDDIYMYSVDANYGSEVERIVAQKGVELTQFQKDALISMAYNLGSKSTIIPRVIDAYSTGSYEDVWNVIKEYNKSSGKELSGLSSRRKAEFALFVTGDYSDQGLFYNRNVTNYNDYNSEGVMERLASCSTGTSGYNFPLPNKSSVTCTSAFGYRIDPVYGGSDYHSGMDLATSMGTDVLASKSGIVTVSGYDESCGNMVKIKHSDGYSTAYCHMMDGSLLVKIGDKVDATDVIGKVGSTGKSTGPHLHIMVYDTTDTKLDPYEYIDVSGVNNPNACTNN